jgi:hypothetical protein
MHLHTIVRVRADSAADAILKVNDLLTSYGEYRIEPFDWIAEDETAISGAVRTEAEFGKLRDAERVQYREHLRSAEEEADESVKGFYLRLAGECLEEARFWSTERIAFDLDGEGARVYYVDTDRHC